MTPLNAEPLRRARSELGEVFISDRAVAAIVIGALQEVPGIRAPHRPGESGVLGALSMSKSKSKAAKGSDVVITGDEGGRLRVKLALVAEYGLKLDELARQAIALVRQRLWSLAGVEAASVEVEIKGLALPSQPPSVGRRR